MSKLDMTLERTCRLLSQKLALIEIDGENVILDTGSTHSLFDPVRGSPFLRRCGIHESAGNLLMPISKIQSTVGHLVPGVHVHALAGADAFARMDMMMDVKAGTVELRWVNPEVAERRHWRILKTETVMGVPVVHVDLAGVRQRLVLDSGCEHGYLLDLPDGGISAPDLEDVHPLTGAFRTESREYEAHLHAECAPDQRGASIPAGSLRFGRLSGMLAMSVRMIGLDGVIGRSLLNQFRFRFTDGLGMISVDLNEELERGFKP